jgi:hypothetical protein
VNIHGTDHSAWEVDVLEGICQSNEVFDILEVGTSELAGFEVVNIYSLPRRCEMHRTPLETYPLSPRSAIQRETLRGLLQSILYKIAR